MDKTTPLPEIALQDTIELAKDYLKNNQLPIENRRLGSARWNHWAMQSEMLLTNYQLA